MLWSFIRLYEKTGDEKFLKYVMDYCDKHVRENGDIPALGLLGIADMERCDRIAAKAYAGLKTKCQIDAEGNANIYDACDGLCVQKNYDVYVDYVRNVNSKEAVAAFLWASQIMEYGL